jgi:hypothetical protein
MKAIFHFSLMALLCLSVSVPAQVIGKDDINRFVGIYSRFEPEIDSPKVSLLRWELVSRDSVRQRLFTLSFDVKTEFAATLIAADQRSHLDRECSWWTMAKPYSRSEFFVFYDGSRWGHNNIMTVWEHRGDDSLEYVCARPAEVMFRVEWVSVFPDSSLLVLLRGSEGDIDFKNGFFSFLRSASTTCEFEEIYRSSWSWREEADVNTRIFYGYDCPVRQITEVTEFSSPVSIQDRRYPLRIDSAKTRIIDLWQKMQEDSQSQND